jgi:outer membrane protein TolC
VHSSGLVRRTPFPLLLSSLLLAACASADAPDARASDDVPALAREIESELAAREHASRGDADAPIDVLLASAPTVVAARHELAVATARARSAGVPATMVDVDHVGGSSKMRESDFAIAFDPLALVGEGRAAAQRERARLDVERAAAALEAVRFHARFDLERSLASVAVAHALEGQVSSFQDDLRASQHRLELLDAKGWLAKNDVANALTMLHHVGAMTADVTVRLASARERAAAVVGVAPAANPRLEEEDETGLEAVGGRAAAASASIVFDDFDTAASGDSLVARQLARQPDLVVARLDLLAAEADVRLAAAQRWPALLIGPKAKLTADDLLFGGMLRLELPWPPASGAELDAARARRDQMRDALVAAVAAAQQRTLARRTEHIAAAESLATHGEQLLVSSAQSLRAATARFAADPAALPEWTMAVDQRTRALTVWSDALERSLVAAFDAAESEGRR